MSERARDPLCMPDPVTGHCITCADEGREGRVVGLAADGFAHVEIEGRVEPVAMDLVDDADVGDHVLVHAGVALLKLERP